MSACSESPARRVDAEASAVQAELTTSADGVVLASDADAGVLAAMGYKQELKRNFRPVEVFGLVFSTMGLVPSIASTVSFALPAGPAGMVWSWFLASGCIFVVALALADLASAFPTAGGLYWWTHHFSTPSLRNYLCFLVGYSNSIGNIAGVCSVAYSFALMLCAEITIATDGAWAASDGIIYAVTLATLLLQGLVVSTMPRFMGRLQSVATVLNLVLILATIVALPIGRKGQRNDGDFIFAKVENFTGWPTGWAFMLAWLSPIWTIASFDCCIHIAEEASNAAQAVPLAIISNGAIGAILGFVVMIVLTSCVSPDIESVLASSYGQPMAQIYYEALGKRGALGFVAFLFVVQFFMGISLVIAASRQLWAFSRDGGLPFSPYLRHVSKTHGYIPFRAIWACVFVAAVLGLLCLIAPAAASALFSMAVAGIYLAWGLPILARVAWGRTMFTPGPVYTGDRFSVPIACGSLVYMAFAVILAMFPIGGPNPTPQNMNYTIVVIVAVWGGASLYFLLSARKWFRGPKTTLEGVDSVSQHLPADGMAQQARFNSSPEAIVTKDDRIRAKTG